MYARNVTTSAASTIRAAEYVVMQRSVKRLYAVRVWITGIVLTLTAAIHPIRNPGMPWMRKTYKGVLYYDSRGRLGVADTGSGGLCR